MRTQILAGGGIVEAQQFAIRAQFQAQHFALQHPASGRRAGGQRPVDAGLQAMALQRRLEQVALGVEQPVLGHAHLGVEPRLPAAVVPPCRRRRDLQHEVRRLALQPHLVARPLRQLRHALGDQNVRPDAPRLAPRGIDQDVGDHVDVRIVLEMHVERAVGRVDALRLPLVVRHGQAVAARVADALEDLLAARVFGHHGRGGAGRARDAGRGSAFRAVASNRVWDGVGSHGSVLRRTRSA